jgi:protein TonB
VTTQAATTEKATAANEERLLLGLVGEHPGSVGGDHQTNGIIGGIVSEASRTRITLAPPLISRDQPPVIVGGRVKEPRLLFSVKPVYPILAKQGGVEGDVTIQAEIDTVGNVIGMKVLSGPPLLQQAATDALRNWKYEPSRLNDQPQPVQLLVRMKFRLH